MGDQAGFPFEIRSQMWTPHKSIAAARKRRSTSVEQRLAQLEAEQDVMDVLSRYTFFYDAKDLDGLLTVFMADCILINPRGTYIGREAIERNYSYLMAQSKVGMHFATNILVNVHDDLKKAWMTAYYYDIGVLRNGRLAGTGGTYADVLVRSDGGWQIAERRITYNFRHLLSPELPNAETPPPTPSRPETSRDLVGPDWEM